MKDFQPGVGGVKRARARAAHPDARKIIVEVSKLRVQRGDTVILNSVDWQVRAGEHWAILGANGSGKTSLLSALSGYLTPSAGAISVLGRNYGQADWRELRKEIGLVSSSIRQMMADDEPALETLISGKYAMIDFWGRPRRQDNVQARAILRQIECEHLAQRRWGVLSQGERQRVLIGRALMARPRLLILDEPCAGLDPAAREHFLQFLQRLGSRKHAPALVLVTHHVEEVVPVLSHVLILKGGQVMEAGPKIAVLNGAVLSAAFETPIRLTSRAGSYSLAVKSTRRVIM